MWLFLWRASLLYIFPLLMWAYCRIKDIEFAELDQSLRTQLVELSARYPDGDRTAAAVVKQLDACTTPECLRDAYAQWQTYFDDNYDLGDVLDYL